MIDHVDDGGLDQGERAELEAYRTAFAAISEVCLQAGAGDLEARVPILDGGDDIAVVRNAINRLLDLTDAFVREAAASLQASSEGRFHRAFLPNGMLGAFGEGARTVNHARMSIKESGQRLVSANDHRLALANDFQAAVLTATEQVAAASTQLGATASGLSRSAAASVREVDQAAGTIATLDESSRRIRQVVTLINQVAAQSRLLALNATIEAARAGEAGKGFAVVANEVKELASQTAQATSRIEQEVEGVESASAQSSTVLLGISRTVKDIHQQVLGIAMAVDGSRDSRVNHPGLAQLAELLRGEVTSFLRDLRT